MFRSVIKNLERELSDLRVKIFKQEMKIEQETKKAEVMRDYLNRWGDQLEKLKVQEAESKAKMNGPSGLADGPLTQPRRL